MAGLCGQCRHSSPSALVPMGNLVKCLGSIARCHVLHVLAKCLARSCSQGQTRELPTHRSHHRALPRQRAATEWRSFGGGAASPANGHLEKQVEDIFVEAVALGTDHSYQAQELSMWKSQNFSILMHFAHVLLGRILDVSWRYFGCVCLCRFLWHLDWGWHSWVAGSTDGVCRVQPGSHCLLSQ